MASSIDDKDFDDPNLWAAIDSAAAASFSTPTTTTTSPSAATAVADKSLTSPITKFPKLQSSPQINQHNHRFSTPQPSIIRKPSVEAPRSLSARIPVKDSVALRPAAKIRDHVDHQLPRKVSRIACVSEVREITPLTSTVAANHAHESACEVTVREVSSFEENTMQIQCWTGGKENEATGPVVGTAIARFPSVSGFKDYQDTAMEILEKSDYIMISGNPYIKKSGEVGSVMDGDLANAGRRDS